MSELSTPPDDTTPDLSNGDWSKAVVCFTRCYACTCEPPISVYDGPSDPAEDCPTHGNPAVTTPPDDANVVSVNADREHWHAGHDELTGMVTKLLAERDKLKAAIADVRRLCEMTIAASCRVQAIDQATDTLAVLARALDAPEAPGDAETEGGQ